MSPNLNAYAERFLRSIRDECLNRMIFIGQVSLPRAMVHYVGHHYYTEPNDEELENRLIKTELTFAGIGQVGVRCRRVQGGGRHAAGPRPLDAQRRGQVGQAGTKFGCHALT